MREVAVRVQPLDGAFSADVLLHVLGHGFRHGHVTCRLHDATGHAYQTQNSPQVAVENRARHEQRDVRPHVEQRPGKLPHRRRHVRSHRQRREAVHPRLVVGLHCREHLLDLSLLKSPVVVLVVQKSDKIQPPVRLLITLLQSITHSHTLLSPFKSTLCIIICMLLTPFKLQVSVLG